jgi:transcription antitermination factor NusG
MTQFLAITAEKGQSMNAQTYHIGQRIPPAILRDIVAGPEIAPVWYALTVGAQKERAVREYLRARDIYAFYPSEERVRTTKGKRYTSERPIVSGCVYAQFRQQPQWHVMKARDEKVPGRLITGVYCRSGQPVAIHRDIIRQLQGLTVEAEALRQARAEMLRVRPGDTATITKGPLTGFAVEVTEVAKGIAWFNFLTGAKASAAVDSLERDLPA